MADFFYTRVNFEEEEPFVYNMNTMPYWLRACGASVKVKILSGRSILGRIRLGRG
jgi:hypothetical protein